MILGVYGVLFGLFLQGAALKMMATPHVTAFAVVPAIMVAAPVVAIDQPVDLSEAAVGGAPSEVHIDIVAYGFRVGAAPATSEAAVIDHLTAIGLPRQARIVVQATPDQDYARVMALMGALNKAGYTHVSLQVATEQ